MTRHIDDLCVTLKSVCDIEIAKQCGLAVFGHTRHRSHRRFQHCAWETRPPTTNLCPRGTHGCSVKLIELSVTYVTRVTCALRLVSWRHTRHMRHRDSLRKLAANSTRTVRQYLQSRASNRVDHRSVTPRCTRTDFGFELPAAPGQKPMSCAALTSHMDYFSRGSRLINQALTTKSADPVATCSQRER